MELKIAKLPSLKDHLTSIPADPPAALPNEISVPKGNGRISFISDRCFDNHEYLSAIRRLAAAHLVDLCPAVHLVLADIAQGLLLLSLGSIRQFTAQVLVVLAGVPPMMILLQLFLFVIPNRSADPLRFFHFCK